MNRRDSPSTGLFVRQSDRDWVEVISGSRVSSGHDESGPALAGWNPVEKNNCTSAPFANVAVSAARGL